MRCYSCGGRLEGVMKPCPYCGVRPVIYLPQPIFRDTPNPNPSAIPMPCPSCGTSLGTIEMTIGGKTTRIERCEACQGLFFNPGELEVLLDEQSREVVLQDIERLDETAGPADEPVVYRKCPVCSQPMIRHNFGGKSSVILDRCGIHGFWLDGGEFRRLEEWWRAGGRLIHQQHEAPRVRWLDEKQWPRSAYGPASGLSFDTDDYLAEERVTNTIKNIVGVLVFLAYIVLRMLR